MRYVWMLRGYRRTEDGLQSPKNVEQPTIKTSYKNLYILLVHLHIYRAFFLSQGCAPLSRRRRWCIATDDCTSSAVLIPALGENSVFETLQTNTTDWAVGASIRARDKYFSFLINVHTCSGAQSASY